MAAIETFEKFVGSGRNVGKRDPRVLVGREVFPAHEVFVVLSDLAAVEDRMYVEWRVGVFGEDEQSGRRMGVEIREAVVGFEERDVEDRVETG